MKDNFEIVGDCNYDTYVQYFNDLMKNGMFEHEWKIKYENYPSCSKRHFYFTLSKELMPNINNFCVYIYPNNKETSSIQVSFGELYNDYSSSGIVLNVMRDCDVYNSNQILLEDVKTAFKNLQWLQEKFHFKYDSSNKKLLNSIIDDFEKLCKKETNKIKKKLKKVKSFSDELKNNPFRL